MVMVRLSGSATSEFGKSEERNHSPRGPGYASTRPPQTHTEARSVHRSSNAKQNPEQNLSTEDRNSTGGSVDSTFSRCFSKKCDQRTSMESSGYFCDSLPLGRWGWLVGAHLACGHTLARGAGGPSGNTCRAKKEVAATSAMVDSIQGFVHRSQEMARISQVEGTSSI